jgi:type VI secretion system secreted protein VgrG
MALGSLLGGNKPVMSITTTAGANKLLVLRMEGEEHLGRLPEWRVDLVGNVTLLGTRETIDLHALLGTRANVTIELHEVKREFNAYIVKAQRGERHGRYEAFSVVMRPWLWFATRNRDSKVFQNVSVKDIVTEVLTPYSADFAWRLLSAAVYKPMEYCVQYDETDFDFVSRLLEEAGIYYFFEHTSTTHTMVLTDSVAKHRSKANTAPIEWANKLQHESSMVDWHRQEEVRSVKATVRDHDYLASATSIEKSHSALPTASTDKLGDAEVYEFTGRLVQNQVRPESQPSVAAATQAAKVKLEALQSLQTLFTGTTNCNDVALGTTFLLAKAAVRTENVNYLVVGLSYSAEFGDHEALEELKSIRRRRDGFIANLVAINMSGNPFRPERRTPRPVMYGPQTATVVGTSGTEVSVDKHGRIKVQFPWDRLGQRNQNSSCFLRVAQPWAGKGMGLWMIPRVGHEVVVSFIGGDPDRPIVTGSVHNDLNPPIYELPAQAHVSGWRTHSTKEGAVDMYNELRFADEKTKEYVWLQAQRNFYRHVKEDAFDFVLKNETKKVKLDRKEVVGDNWYLNVGKDVMHELGKDFHLKVAGDLFTTGGATYQLKLTKDMSVQVGADLGLDVTGKAELKAGGDVNVQTNGAANVKATGNVVVEATGKVSLKATSDIVMAGMNIKMKGNAEAVIEAPMGIKLVCGGSVITLGPAGVTIDGPLVKVNCGGGGGSAGAAESAAAAQPKAPADAKNLELLTAAQAADYDKLFDDPIRPPAAGGAA